MNHFIGEEQTASISRRSHTVGKVQVLRLRTPRIAKADNRFHSLRADYFRINRLAAFKVGD
jgi:hypothetical protein